MYSVLLYCTLVQFQMKMLAPKCWSFLRLIKLVSSTMVICPYGELLPTVTHLQCINIECRIKKILSIHEAVPLPWWCPSGVQQRKKYLGDDTKLNWDIFFFSFFFWAWRSKTWVFLMRLLGTSASCQACRKSKRTVSVEFKRIVNSNLEHFAGGKKILSLWQPPSDFVRWFMNLFKCNILLFFLY